MNCSGQPNFSETSLIKLKDALFASKQRIAGLCVAKCLKQSKTLIESATPNLSLKDLEQACHEIILSMDCSPTFFGYKGFPGKICASVNTQIVHGIPSDYQLQPGDVVKMDLGATYQGVIADAAITAIYGSPKEQRHLDLVNVCQGALDQAIGNIEVGKQLGCIGHAIHKYVSSKSNFGLITQYGGHGIEIDMPHAAPFVYNKAKSNEGIRIQPGLVLAIEPMLVIGDTRTQVKSDGWTVVGSGIAAHFEHTVFVHADKVEVMTDWKHL